jgi:hypothetical protein
LRSPHDATCFHDGTCSSQRLTLASIPSFTLRDSSYVRISDHRDRPDRRIVTTEIGHRDHRDRRSVTTEIGHRDRRDRRIVTTEIGHRDRRDRAS